MLCGNTGILNIVYFDSDFAEASPLFKPPKLATPATRLIKLDLVDLQSGTSPPNMVRMAPV
jgi:hypothetical protein